MKFCPSCGSSLREGARFCESCGTPVAATTAPAATPPAPPVPAPPQPVYEQEPVTEVLTGSTEPPPAAPRKSRRGLLTAIGGVAAVGVLGVVGYVVYDQLNGPAGGADSPSAAVLELSSAASGEDAVTALSLLPPGEVGPIVDLYRDVEKKATSTGVAAKDHPFAGFDLKVDGVAVKTEELGPDVAAVTITGGTVSWALNPDELQGPLRIEGDGDVRRPTDGSADLVEITRNASSGSPLRLMTVQRDGKWYVSPMYTLLELWRTQQGLPEPDFSKEIDYSGTGADSAEAAVQEAAQRLAAFDVDGFLDLLSPDEAAALYQYRDAIMTSLHQDGALAELQSEIRLSVDKVESEKGDEVDDRVPVTIKSASGTASDDHGDSYSWSLDRNCFSYSGNGDSDGACLQDVLADEGFAPDLAAQFPSLTLLTQEKDGRWYLSPMATVVGQVRKAVNKFDTDDVAGLLGVPQFGGVDGQLKDGEPIEGTVDEPYAHSLYEMDVPAGKVFSTCVQDGVGLGIYGPDGRLVDGSAALAEKGGRYRAMVSREDTGTFTITGRIADVEEAPVPGRIPAGGDDDCGARIVSIDATQGQGLVFDNTVSITAPNGDTTYGSALMPKESGRYLVTVPGYTGLSIDPLPADVLTVGSQVTGTLTGSGPVTFRVFVDEGQHPEIQVFSGGTVLPSVELYDQWGSEADSSGSGYAGYAAVYPYSYDDAAQVYELQVSDYFNDSGTFQVAVVEN